MPRVSRKEAEKHREDVLNAASRLFLEHGIHNVSVPAVMAEAGLTHGGFYGHFESKEALIAEACERAFEMRRGNYEGVRSRRGTDRKAARAEFVKRYTSKAHRDAVGLGCPAAALCGDVARPDAQGQVRTAFSESLATMIEGMTPLLSRKKKGTREDVMAQVAMLVGGVLLSRATKGFAISDELMQSVRSALSEG